MIEKKILFRAVLQVTLCAAMVFMTTGCFKEIDPESYDPSNPGSGNSLNSGLIAYYSFDDGTGSDGTTNHVDGILLNGVLTTEGIRGNGVLLNGWSNQYFNIPYNLFSGLEKFSVSFWIKNFGPGCIFAAQNTSSGNRDSDVPQLFAEQSGKFFFSAYSKWYGADFSYDYQRQGIQAEAWHHIVVTMRYDDSNSSGATAKLYIDGSLVDQATVSYSKRNISQCSKVVFGGDKEGGYDVKMSMSLDEVNIYNRELTASEVRGLYNLNY